MGRTSTDGWVEHYRLRSKKAQKQVHVLASFELGVTRAIAKAAALFRLAADGLSRTCQTEMTCLPWTLPKELKRFVQEESIIGLMCEVQMTPGVSIVS